MEPLTSVTLKLYMGTPNVDLESFRVHQLSTCRHGDPLLLPPVSSSRFWPCFLLQQDLLQELSS